MTWKQEVESLILKMAWEPRWAPVPEEAALWWIKIGFGKDALKVAKNMRLPAEQWRILWLKTFAETLKEKL